MYKEEVGILTIVSALDLLDAPVMPLLMEDAPVPYLC